MTRRLRSYLDLVCRIWQAPGNIGRRPQAVLRSVAWLVNKKTLRRPWTLGVFDGLRLRCHPDSIIALHVVQRGEFHDWDTANFITGFLRHGDVFVDVGANIGLYTLPASKIVKHGRVVAVEPGLSNRTRLEENLRLNHVTSVRVEACALGEKTGETAFCEADALAHIEPGGKGPTVPLRTLDDILPDGEGTLLKVDVEGFELSVFKGAQNAMRAGRLPVILFEMNRSHERYGFTEEEIFAFLRGQGYQIARYEHDGRRLVTHGLEGDVVAFTPRGKELIEQRLLT